MLCLVKQRSLRREDTVEAAWAVVDPVLKNIPKAFPYKRGSWGRKRQMC